jgi:hypothetical protein
MADDTDYKAIAVAQSERLRQLETAADDAQVNASLAEAINSHPVIDDGRGQLAQILRGKVTLVPNGSGGKVAMADGKPLKDFVAETLSRQDYSHFIRPDSRGASRTTTPAGATGTPATLADAIRQHVREQKAQGEDGRTNPRLPMPMQPVYKKD